MLYIWIYKFIIMPLYKHFTIIFLGLFCLILLGKSCSLKLHSSFSLFIYIAFSHCMCSLLVLTNWWNLKFSSDCSTFHLSTPFSFLCLIPFFILGIKVKLEYLQNFLIYFSDFSLKNSYNLCTPTDVQTHLLEWYFTFTKQTIMTDVFGVRGMMWVLDQAWLHSEFSSILNCTVRSFWKNENKAEQEKKIFFFIFLQRRKGILRLFHVLRSIFMVSVSVLIIFLVIGAQYPTFYFSSRFVEVAVHCGLAARQNLTIEGKSRGETVHSVAGRR